MKNFSLTLATMLVAVVLIGAGCSSDTTETSDTNTAETAVEESTAAATVSTSGNSFTPETVTIAVGESVEFDLGASHNAVEVSKETYDAKGTEALADGFEVGFGGNETVTFDEAGTYYYVCEPHAAMGMLGMIVVE